MIRALFPELPLVQSTKHVRCILKTSMFQPFGNPNALYVGEVCSLNGCATGRYRKCLQSKGMQGWVLVLANTSVHPSLRIVKQVNSISQSRIQFKINSTISGTIKLTRRTKPKWIYPAQPKSFRPKEILHTWIVSSSVFIVFVPFPEGTKMYEPNIVWGIN